MRSLEFIFPCFNDRHSVAAVAHPCDFLNLRYIFIKIDRGNTCSLYTPTIYLTYKHHSIEFLSRLGHQTKALVLGAYLARPRGQLAALSTIDRWTSTPRILHIYIYVKNHRCMQDVPFFVSSTSHIDRRFRYVYIYICTCVERKDVTIECCVRASGILSRQTIYIYI
jgi:hypothetical protein